MTNEHLPPSSDDPHSDVSAHSHERIDGESAASGTPSSLNTAPASAPAQRAAGGRAGRDVLMALAGGVVVLAVTLLMRDRLPILGGASSTPAANTSVSEAATNDAASTIEAVASGGPPGALASSAQGLGAFPVKDISGATVPIVENGESAIVMINSRTCGYCKLALRDLGEYANGRPVPGLRMLTLEGAIDGAPMLVEARINGAVPLGPATSQSQILLTFRYRGTPTFVAVDAEGRIRGTMAGYPGPEQLRPWFDVMLGESPAP